MPGPRSSASGARALPFPGRSPRRAASSLRPRQSVAHSRSASARLRLLTAQRELAEARQAPDPVSALDAARRAMREAEDAKALADYERS